MNKLLPGLMLALTATAVMAQEESFVCQYVTQIEGVHLSGKKPKSVVSKINTRFGFYIDAMGKASYVNLDKGWKGNISAARIGAGWHFSERSISDNLFIVTIFEKKNAEGMYPSLMSFHAWKDIDEYAPKLSYGFCR